MNAYKVSSNQNNETLTSGFILHFFNADLNGHGTVKAVLRITKQNGKIGRFEVPEQYLDNITSASEELAVSYESMQELKETFESKRDLITIMRNDELDEMLERTIRFTNNRKQLLKNVERSVKDIRKFMGSVGLDGRISIRYGEFDSDISAYFDSHVPIDISALRREITQWQKDIYGTDWVRERRRE